MSCFLGKNRLRIADYSSELKATVDTLVETYIAENQHDQAGIEKLNKAREEWFNEADECETSNLAELEKREERDTELQDDQLLTRFCFIFEFQGDVLDTGCFTWHFVSTDTYMTPGQIACFQAMIVHLACDNCGFTQTPPTGPECLKIIFKSFKPDFYTVSKYRFF
jgi:hypothetical protein